MPFSNGYMNTFRHLYIIGNGFDMYHGADSSYTHFREYLLHHNVDVVKSLEFFFGPKSLRNTVDSYYKFRWYTEDFKHLRIKAPETEWANMFLWQDFEKYLSSLNREKLFDILDRSLPRSKRQELQFQTKNYQKSINSILSKIDLCTYEMRYQFHKWIKTVHYAKGYKARLLDIDTNACFLNFNYTTFLEDVYGIPTTSIKYIHGCKRDKYGSLVLGHCQDYEKGLEEWIYKNKKRKRYRPNLKDKKGNYYSNGKLCYLAYFADSLDYANWMTESRHETIIDVKNRIETYYQDNFKNSNKIIKLNKEFFLHLSEICEITVLGHSLGEVDHNYFKSIIETNKDSNQIEWTFSWYSDDDKKRIAKFKEQFGLKKVNCIHMG